MPLSKTMTSQAFSNYKKLNCVVPCMKPAEKNKGFNRLWKALGYSGKGLVGVWKTEAAFRQEVMLAAVLIPLALWLDISPVERVLLLSSVMLVLIVELMNSAIEAVVDRIGLERHPLSGKAKDQGSAAVLLSLCVVALTWGIILWPKLSAFVKAAFKVL